MRHGYPEGAWLVSEATAVVCPVSEATAQCASLPRPLHILQDMLQAPLAPFDCFILIRNIYIYIYTHIYIYVCIYIYIYSV